jgi:guanylate kinase
MKRKGIPFVISSPSGVGKTTIADFLVKRDDNIKRSVSYTTRKKRGIEKHGLDYFFVDRSEFLHLVEQNKMLEYAKVFTDYYGTPMQSVQNMLNSGIDILFCIDWQGAMQIKQKLNTVSIFLLPPSLEELKSRLQIRDTDKKDVIDYRLKIAKEEIKQYKNYDYVVVNDNLEEAQDVVFSIIKAARHQALYNKSSISEIVKNLSEGFTPS